jgi:hypothetical protein
MMTPFVLKWYPKEDNWIDSSMIVAQLLVLLLGILRRAPHPPATLVPFYFPGGALPF